MTPGGSRAHPPVRSFCEGSLVRWIRILAVALVARAGLLLFQYGTLSPCGMLRVEVRQHATQEGGDAALLATAVSDSVLDTLLAARYGPLTPGRCLGLVLRREPVTIVPP
jgi:hypothetical protein